MLHNLCYDPLRCILLFRQPKIARGQGNTNTDMAPFRLNWPRDQFSERLFMDYSPSVEEAPLKKLIHTVPQNISI